MYYYYEWCIGYTQTLMWMRANNTAQHAKYRAVATTGEEKLRAKDVLGAIVTVAHH